MSTTTPSRPQQENIGSTPSKGQTKMQQNTPNRRVLGEMTPNALLGAGPTRDDVGKAIQAPRPSSPLKQMHTISTSAIGPKKESGSLLLSPSTEPSSVLGRKRSIYEVENVQDENSGISVRNMNAERAIEAHQKTTQPHVQLEAMTAEDDDLSTTEADTPEIEERNIRHDPVTQEVSQSFSDLIDYNADDVIKASQQSHSEETKNEPYRDDNIATPPTLGDSRPHKTPKLSPVTIKERAEALRLRLRVAMYKVQTDQDSVPLASLQLPSPPSSLKTPRARDVNRHQPDVSPTPSIETLPSRSPIRAPLQSASPTRQPSRSAMATATAGGKSAGSLLPAPILRPTANPSRRDIVYSALPPSSPPQLPSGSVSPQRKDARNTNRVVAEYSEDEDYATPIASRRTLVAMEEALEDGSPTSERRMGPTRRDRVRDDDEGLSSSVVRGRAASHLLELMRGR